MKATEASARAYEEAGRGLVEALERQVVAYHRLLELGQSKQEALVDGDVADLRRVVIEEQVVLGQVLECETAQAAASSALSLGVGGDPLGYLPAEYRERAQTARLRLGEAASQLSLLVRANSELIRRARAFVDLSLSRLGQASGSPVYDGSGNVAAARRNITAAGLSRRL